MTIQEILDERKVPYLSSGHHHCRPGWIQLDCPFCGPGTQRYHLGWNLSLRYGNCWKCGGHHPEKILRAFGIARETARELARGLDTGEVISRERRRISLLEPAGRGPFKRAHREYLRSRGFDPKVISSVWQVEGIAVARRLSWRLYIPIVHQTRRVSWTTRAIGSKVEQRYISASAEEEEINHKELIYGLDYCRHSVVIVEGPTDAWNVGPGAGAVFGTAFSSAQVKKLVEVPYRYVCFDSSDEAQARARELARQLSLFAGVTENIVLDAKDPGSASPKEIRLLRKAAKL